MSKLFFAAPDPAHLKKERAKARELRASQWWKQQLGKGVCYHCEQRFSKDELTMDHLLPLARGGKTTKKNVVVACKSCNSSKGHQTATDKAFESLDKES